jgi:uncharacterized protein (TIGR02145 family)
VAPENFVLEKEIILTGVDKSGDPDEVTVLHAGKKFFTLDEAEELQEQGYFPEGWRLPTVTEARAWLTELIDKNLINLSGKIMAQLGLKLDGYIYPSMNIYNFAPTDKEAVNDLIVDRMIEGRFWLLSDTADDNAQGLTIHRVARPKVQSFYRGCGHSVRLVHD